MKILIIHEGNRPDHPTYMLMRAAKSMGHEPFYVRMSRIDLEIGNKITMRVQGDTTLTAFKAGLIRSFGFLLSLAQFFRRIALLTALERIMPLMNPPSALLSSRNKLLTTLMLKEAGIKVPYTFSTESLRSAYKVADTLGSSVVKPIIGSRGYGVALSPNPDTAFIMLKALLSNKEPPLIQEYLGGTGYDIRIIIVGDRVLGAMKRVASKSWKTNIAQGGKGEPYEVDGELEDLALRATKALGLWYAGVDVIIKGGEYYVLEVNGSPDWREFTRVTGIDPSYEIVDYLVKVADDYG